jgi:DNA-binding NtrC family response regulator
MSAEAPDRPPGEPEQILIVDDDPTNLHVLLQTLKGRGFKLLVARSGEDCLKTARSSAPQLILLDVVMPGIDGFETCRLLKEDPRTRDASVIFLSALDQAADKVRGFGQGAVDFITKPFQSEEVIARVETHLEIGRLRRALERRNEALQHELRVASELLMDARQRVEASLLGESVSVRALRESIDAHARSVETLLLTGQPGAGQEAVARAIHHASARGAHAFIHVNCAMLPADHHESLWSEPTAHERPVDGAGYGKLALAAGGTLYLEAVERLPPRLQVSLAEVVAGLDRQHEGDPGQLPDVRVIASSRDDLIEKAQQGRFDGRLADLLSSCVLRVPSLVERKDDIPALVAHFVGTHARRLGSLVTGVSADSLRRLCKYRWPGNIAELESLIERSLVTAREPLLEIDRALLEEGVPLGHYRLLRKIGQGGMGEVWLAKHQVLARPAAIKLIRLDSLEEHDRSHALVRFQREAQATARLSSPYTVRLFDFGVSETGALYYVMELLRGLDLASVVARFGPPPVERVASLLAQACHSLAEAHEAGLVHRDIKPANLFLCRLGSEFDCLKVLDFGIVKSDSSEDRATMTQTTTVTGTPAFLAPEMVLGASVGPPADIYALGCVAWYLLTGRNVFTGELAQVLTDHLQSMPEPPSHRAKAAIPVELDDIVMQCLRKEPGERPPSARALGAMFERLAWADPWSQDRAEHWWRAHLPEHMVDTHDDDALAS